MKDTASFSFSRRAVFISAFRYSVPVLLGYSTIGLAFGLMLSGGGYPWWLSLSMSLWMYAGAGQFIAAGLFMAGTSLWEACIIQLVVNARHIAYGLSMLKRFGNMGPYKPYMIFSLTDETFALLSSLPSVLRPDIRDGEEEGRRQFMFYDFNR
jgi:4-azaleucine resistance transporter AzlC